MLGSFFKKASVAVLAATAGLFATASADAGSLPLGTSGWTVSWSDPNLTVLYDFESRDAVYIEKFVNFTADDVNEETGANIDGKWLVFQKTSPNAVPYIIVNDEAVINQTGLDWSGFEFSLAPNDGRVQFDAGRTNISPPGTGFSIDPFTTHQYSVGNTVLEVGGGLVPTSPSTDNVWYPGSRSGGLAIQTGIGNDLPAFGLKEMPIAAPAPAPIIPLPAAAWTGLSGLIGLALINARKSLKSLLA